VLFPYAKAIYVVGGLTVVLLSIVFARRYPSPFFRYSTIGFACTFSLVVLETVNTEVSGTSLGGAVIAIVLLMGGFCFLRSSDRLLDRPSLPWQVPTVSALAALSVVLGALGQPGRWIVMIGGLFLTGAMVRLGMAFLKLPNGRSYWWLGSALILLGLWPILVPYPVLQGTEFAWIGFLGSGIFQVVVGGGLLAYLLDDAWSKYREEQARTDRLKTEFISIVSHELRTPLTSILGYTEFLEDEIAGPLAEGQREYLHQIQRNSQRLQRLVDDLLDFSMLQGERLRLQLSEGELGAQVRGVVDSLSPQAGKAGIQLVASVPDVPIQVPMDPDRIEQVISNLVGNALKFTPAGGRVTVSLKIQPNEATVEVADTGIGIPADKLPHIFDKFYQVDGTLTRSREGAGLGLAIARAIAESHGGTLTAESVVGQGSTFRLTLPHHPLERQAEPVP
jgi:signal transduction histidine kinase